MGFRKADIATAEHMPRITPLIGNGITYSQMKATEQTVDRLMRVAFRSQTCDKLPAGFNYLNYEVCDSEKTHQIRINQLTNGSKSWRVPFTLARTDSYLVKYNFENKGDPVSSKFDIQLELPYVRRGGIIAINGKDYTVSAVIKTRGLSVTDEGYFSKFLPNKVKIKYFTVSMMAGTVVHVPVPTSDELHRRGSYSTRRRPCLPYWIYSKYGVTEAFKRYLNTDIKIIQVDDDKINRYRLSKEWVLCEHLHLDKRHCRSDFAIAIPVKDFTAPARSMIASIFHLVNDLGDRMLASELDDNVRWRILLGNTIFGLNMAEYQLLYDMERHIYEIESYIDDVFHAELTSEGIEVDNIYDFFYYIVNRLTTRRTADMADLGNLWGRYYTSLEYVLYDLQAAIMTQRWSLRNKATDGKGNFGLPNRTKAIRNDLCKALKRNLIRNLAKPVHAEVKALDTTSDNMILGGCAKALDQSVAQRSDGGKGRGLVSNNRATLLHASHATHGSILNLQQGDPLVPNNVNPYGTVDDFGRIYLSDKLKPVAMRLTANFNRKSE